MVPNDLSSFLNISKKSAKKATKKKTSRKSEPIEEDKIEFPDDPKEIQQFLIEVAECGTKSSLISIAKEYQMRGASQCTVEELQDKLHELIRGGARKKIGYLKEIGYIKWVYKCKCGYQKVVKTKKDLAESHKLNPEICPKCGKPFALKQEQ